MIPEEEAEGWVDISEEFGFRANRNMIIVHAKGDSMLDKIHDGDLCVFELYGTIMLVHERGTLFLLDARGKTPIMIVGFTIKKYHSVWKYYEDGTREHEKIELIPLNKEYETIELDSETEYRTVGIFKCVL